MKNYFDLTGRVALVTGASSGLGVQIAKALANQGADLAIVARRESKLLAVKEEIEALGVKCYIHCCDVSNVEEIKQTVKDVEAHYGKIDILCNNAGIGLFDAAEKQSDEIWQTMMHVNLDAPYYFSREVAKGMIERGYGRIIMTGSIHSTVGMMELPLSAYATTKGGIRMMVKQLATEWAKYGITVNAIGPAYFPSEMTSDVIGSSDFQEVIKARCPMGRAGRDGELDGAVIYFASEASSYTTGQLLSIDGGWTAI
ncbi:MAG: SDR family oxidoreductase [Oscillospiraceae bacterium]|nr:SDR family oxidoreductase [Oscillospiraceae bacterium]